MRGKIVTVFIASLLLATGIFGATIAQAADVNNFIITSYNVNMTLGQDGDKRSTLQTTETITANFPASDQNHGLERAFVKEYDGHSLSFRLNSVADGNGKSLDYHWEGNNLRIGDADRYVHGMQTYVISYSLRDVTKSYSDTNSDEFYWDAIGTDWQVPIQHAVVHLTIDSSLSSSLTGNAACYSGALGATMSCPLEQSGESFSTKASDLDSYQGVSIAIGFKKATFAAYQPSLTERLVALWLMVQVVATLLGVIFLIGLVMGWSRRLNRSKEMGTIIAEYLPPDNASVTTSARIGGYRMSIMTAQMLDFAVRHYIKIYEVKAKSVLSPAQYEIEVIRDPSELRQEEQETLRDTFGSLPSVGKRINLKELQNNPSYYRRTLNNDTDLDKLIRGTYEFRKFDDGMKKWMRRWAMIALLIALLVLSPAWLITAIILFILSSSAWRFTDKGLTLKRYLEGLKLYINVAEKDRIKMMQSPDGAEKIQSFTKGDPSSDPKLLIKLYERVLPYAVLFGQEKKWNTQLGRYYETAGSQPDWYSGQGVFNAVVFSSAMSNFSSANNYASSSSSSSGGSSGGGFSGGGGGGGGGGGW